MALGFEPVLPPVLVREAAMYGTGFLPTEEVNLYQVPSDGLYLTGTSEVALAALHQGEILPADELPLRYAGYSTCFRREAGAAGRDTRGMFRVHQFDKVEMFFFVHPGAVAPTTTRRSSPSRRTSSAALGIAYRVVVTAAGDLGPSAAKKYDLEAWIPSQQRYREITSCSNTTDYQARRLNVRFRDDGRLAALPAHLERDRDDGEVPDRPARGQPGRGRARGRAGGAPRLRRAGAALSGPLRVAERASGGLAAASWSSRLCCRSELVERAVAGAETPLRAPPDRPR